MVMCWSASPVTPASGAGISPPASGSPSAPLRRSSPTWWKVATSNAPGSVAETTTRSISTAPCAILSSSPIPPESCSSLSPALRSLRHAAGCQPPDPHGVSRRSDHRRCEQAALPTACCRDVPSVRAAMRPSGRASVRPCGFMADGRLATLAPGAQPRGWEVGACRRALCRASEPADRHPELLGHLKLLVAGEHRAIEHRRGSGREGTAVGKEGGRPSRWRWGPGGCHWLVSRVAA